MRPSSALSLALVLLCAVGCGPDRSGESATATDGRVSRFGEYSGYTEARFDGWERSSELVPMRDSVRIAIDYFRPTADGRLHEEPLPVIWTHTRYERANLTGGVLNTALDLFPYMVTLVSHGYVVAIVDVRGSGASFGTKVGWFPPEEARDAYDITEWLGTRPWSNGNVGMYGLSYLGITQYFAASEAPPHLKAIFPAVAWLDAYNFAYPGGIFTDRVIQAWGNGVQSSDTSAALPSEWRAMVTADRRREARSRAAPDCVSLPCSPMGGPIPPVDADPDAALLRAATAEHLASPNLHDLTSKLPYRDSKLPGAEQAFHVERSLYPRLDALRAAAVPAYHLGGWYDGFPRETVLYWWNYPGPQKMVIGPWYHPGFAHFDPGAEFRRWFDYWLKDIDNGILNEPPIHYWTLGAPAGTEWRSAATWPLPEEQRVAFYFGAGPTGSVASANDGALTRDSSSVRAGGDSYTVDYTTTVGADNRWTRTAGGGSGGEPYADLAANDRKALTYTTDVLDADLEVTGHPVAHLWITSTASDGDFFVYLEEVLPDGSSVMVTEGMLRASHRALADPPYDTHGLPWHPSRAADQQPLEPREPAELVLDLMPTSVLFHRGSRIRVVVTGADAYTFRTAPVSPAPTIEVLRDPEHRSRIILPVIPARGQ